MTVDYGSGPALNGIDLRIPAGTTLAVVGHTGSGKSTLVNLLPRLFDPTGGAVLLDGIDLRSLDPAELRRQIGFVPQETFLFSATIADNIAFGVEDATPEQIRRAAEMAGLAGDIEGFPLGYETMVGERGITLSGGQKQRTAIARALLRDPRILILDDALSAVDTADRGAHSDSPGGRDAGTDRDPDLAPRLHRAAGRHDRGAGARQDRRAGHARRVGGGRRILRGALSEADAGRRVGSDLTVSGCRAFRYNLTMGKNRGQLKTLVTYSLCLAMAAPVWSADMAPLRGYTAESAGTEREWETKFRAIPDPAALRAYMERLAARPHHVGSPYDKDNAEWIAAKAKEWGLDAQIETFDVLFPTPKERALEMTEPTHFVAKIAEPTVSGDATSAQHNEQLPVYNAYSIDGDVTAPLVYVNYGIPADYEELDRLGISVKGAIVIARYGG